MFVTHGGDDAAVPSMDFLPGGTLQEALSVV